MSGMFYAELLGCGDTEGRRISDFMDLCAMHKASIPKATPWAGHGKVRVYFDFWSQNKRPPMTDYEKFYYCAETDDIYMSGYHYGRTRVETMQELAGLGGGFSKAFSGRKTRDKIEEFVRGFYEQKAIRG